MTDRDPPPRRRVARAMADGTRRLGRWVDGMFSVGGAGFRSLAISHASAVAGDTLVAMSLAGTLFFQVPSSEARGNMALYLVLTLAPFAVLGPVLTGVFRRFPTAYRSGLLISTASRVLIVVAMLVVGVDTFWLFPLTFLLLVMSRIHGISRGSLLPVALEGPIALVSANARLARLGIIGSVIAVPLGALLVAINSRLGLVASLAAFVISTTAAGRLPRISPVVRHRPEGKQLRIPPRAIRMARLATTGVRFLNGFLLLLVAFAFRDQDAGILDFGALLGAAGLGFFISSLISPFLEQRLREEPMVVAALAIESAAAFIAAQAFGLPAAAALAAAAGLAWGTAKFGYDGLLQATLDESERGHAFTISETIFQIAWVLGALAPVLAEIPPETGLALAGLTALVIQVVYISGLLVPLTEARRARRAEASDEERPPVTDLF